MRKHPIRKPLLAAAAIEILGAVYFFLIGSASAAIPTGVTCVAAFGTDAANKFAKPVFMAEIPGQDGNFLVLEQDGRIFSLKKNGRSYSKEPFLTVGVRTNRNELGLLGLAFHPKFAENRKYYLYFNPDVLTGEFSVVQERKTDATFFNDSGEPPKVIFNIDRVGSYGHNGGTLAFGKDGYLYLGLGDAEAFREPQLKTSFFGKILRVDVDAQPGDKPYAIPADNPFAADADPAVKKEIWAMGLRNPYRFSFDRLNGDLWAGDVGWNSREEVDRIVKGGNYGWSDVEGDICGQAATCNPAAFLPPVAIQPDRDYDCIIGGHVYRGSPASAFYGVYIHGDYDSKTLWGLSHKDYVKVEHVKIGTCRDQISSVSTDALGNLYVTGHLSGAIYALTHQELPTISASSATPRPADRARKADGKFPRGRLAGPAAVYRQDGSLALSVPAGNVLDEAWSGRLAPGVYFLRSLEVGHSLDRPFVAGVRP